MPTYDYRCEADGKVYEARHPMSVDISNWGELCRVAGLDANGIAADTPVSKLLTTGGVVSSNALKNPEAPPCASSNCCGGVCGI